MLVGGFEVHIGNSRSFENNAKCSGGPFLVCDNCIRSWSLWPGGFEAWCGMEGKYVSVVRDSSAASVDTNVNICTLGIISGGSERCRSAEIITSAVKSITYKINGSTLEVQVVNDMFSSSIAGCGHLEIKAYHDGKQLN